MIGFNSAPYSRLFDNETFDYAFLKDMRKCRSSLVIESPFVRLNRVLDLLPVFTSLRNKGVQVVINTRPPEEHDTEYQYQAEQAVLSLQDIGVRVLFTVKHHRKLAIGRAWQ